MNSVLRTVGIAASVVVLAFGATACKKADNSSTGMSGPAATSEPMGASGAASTGAASGASQ
ncbi:hypothetical protein [Paraburkholderia rhizosphaerae]|uniref:Lipoprotein n=1 Tax=Paraburkholderia rhizosphaerae TaxID=480658 RepID=A0A4R8L3E5_9BURK|nr:hypothetical protein [Paraburkholderia rhizosphaerae]TDY37066.1 hypothetical protein BX592_1459 [Paraburkholderia rhizosphaerae]